MKARRSRSVAIAVALALFVVLVYVVSIARLGPDAPHPADVSAMTAAPDIDREERSAATA